eukprot:scaffold7085_cov120-Isochrysis_galbana.AAC.4
MNGGSWDALPSELTEIILTIRHRGRVQAAQILARIARGMRVRAILARARRLLRGRPMLNLPLALQRRI